MLKLSTSIIKNIAVFRALQLGDILCSIPALRSLRKAYPDAHIIFLGLPGTAQLVNRFNAYIDEFIAFPGYPGLPEQNYDQEKYNLFLEKIRSVELDLLIQLQGNGSIVNHMLAEFDAKYLAGFCETMEQENAMFLTYPNFGHEITRHLALMAHLGVSGTGTALEFPLFTEDYAQLEVSGLSLRPGSYICVHPGSRGSWRQWPALYFASLADYCADRGFKIVLTGTAEELHLVNKVAQLMKAKPIVSAGKTSLGTVAVLLKNSFALISNCTGISHLASALGTPALIISMDGETERWAPLNRQLQRTIDWSKTPDYHLVFKDLTALFFRL